MIELDQRQKVKLVAGLLGTGAVDFLLGGLTMAVLPANIPLIMKIGRWAGCSVLALMADEKIGAYVDRSVDYIYDSAEELKRQMEIEIENINKTKKEEMGA